MNSIGKLIKAKTISFNEMLIRHYKKLIKTYRIIMAQPEKKEIKIELTPEVAQGKYANLAVISHGPAEFFLDMICLAPNTPQAKVQSRIIMSPENVKQLMFALQDNIKKYEAVFGEIKPRVPGNNGGTTPPVIPFMGNN